MRRVASFEVSQWALAVAIIAIGVCGLAVGDFVAAWQPVPKALPAREPLAFLCAAGCIAAGAALPWARGAAFASGALLAAFLLWMVMFRVPAIFQAPTAAVSYESWGECAVMVAAAWLIRSRSAAKPASPWLAFIVGARGKRVARSIFALALIAFGIAHFAYARDTAALVPTWLPAHAGWVYLTGTTYVAAGLAILAGLVARPAAILAAWQMGLFTVLVWIPAVVDGHPDASQWSELLDSWALAAGAWVVAASYRA
jgi:uncharacterized membrane protein